VNPAAYLERIGWDGPLTPSADTLAGLHAAHMHCVPFENLSIHMGEPIVLDERALFEKIVLRRRGGFCYELNGLFAWLLRTLGFRVSMLAAEVRSAAGEWGPPFDHMALLVALDEPWLADVGFGDSFVEPLRLAPGVEQAQHASSYRMEQEGDRWMVVRRTCAGPWIPQYRFDLTPHPLGAYEAMCLYHQTSPESHFTQNRVCSMATPAGRITISGTRLIRTTSSERVERELAGDAEYLGALSEHFGIGLGAAASGWPDRC
jgi:N-hydroxyarylamine O-acetyltransferase